MRNRFDKFSELQEAVHTFISARNWQEFHNPKDLAVSISLEAAELMEKFNWKSISKIAKDLEDTECVQNIGEELADVVILCASFANYLNLDLGKITADKIIKNNKKYPIESAEMYSKKWR